MNFSLSKPLRVLGVVDFAVFLVDLLLTSCLSTEITWNNHDHDHDHHLSARDDAVHPRAVRLCNNAKSVVAFTLGSLQLAILIAVIILLFDNVRVCHSSHATAVLVLSACVLAARPLSFAMTFVLARFKETPMHADDEVKLRQIEDGLPESAEHVTQKASALCDRVGKSQKLVVMTAIATFLVTILIPFALTMLGVFFFLTAFKLAIPGQYEAPCGNNSNTALLIMVGLPVLLLFGHLVQLLVAFGSHWSGRKGPPTIVNLAGQLGMSIVVGVLSTILFVRISKVWRGEELQLYEYLAFAVSVPLVRM